MPWYEPEFDNPKWPLYLHYINCGLTLAMSVVAIVFGVVFDLLQYSPAINNSMLWSYYFLNFGLGVFGGITLLLSFLWGGLIMKGHAKMLSLFCDVAVGIAMLTIGALALFYTNASDPIFKPEYHVDDVLEHYTTLDKTYEKFVKKGSSHGFVFSQKTIEDDLIDLFIGTDPTAGFGLSSVPAVPSSRSHCRRFSLLHERRCA